MENRYSDRKGGTSSGRDPSRESVRETTSSHAQRGEMLPPTTIPSHALRRPSHGSRDMPPPPLLTHKMRQSSISSTTSASAASPAVPSHRSPTLSTASPRTQNGLLTPVLGSSHQAPQEQPFALKAPTITDIQEFSKESMQTAAERARERRKLEEQQREKEKERARQKAAELAAAAEAKVAAQHNQEEVANQMKAEAEAAAEALINEEVEALAKLKPKAVNDPTHSITTHSATGDTSLEPSIWRARSSRGSKRNGGDIKAVMLFPTPKAEYPQRVVAPQPSSSVGPLPLNVPSIPSRPRTASWANVVKDSDKIDGVSDSVRRGGSSAIGGDSWRTKSQVPALPLSVTMPPLFDVGAEDHDTLELFDFTDMHKLVGDNEESDIPDAAIEDVEVVDITEGSPESTHHHYVAGISPPSLTSRQSIEPGWHGKGYLAQSSSSPERGVSPQRAASPRGGLSSPAVSTKGPMSPQTFAGVPLPPSKRHFRESSMSALEDAMSRIKGALSDMRPGESSAAIDLELAAASLARKTTKDEPFAITQISRPSTPPPAHRRLHVRIRKEWPPRSQDPINKRSLHLWKLPPRPVRWDILSWEPPVEGMSRKTLSRDEILFPLSSASFIVSLPKASIGRSTLTRSLAFSPAPAPKVNLPSSLAGHRTSHRSGHEAHTSMLEIIESVSRSPPPSSPARRASLSLPTSDVSQSSLQAGDASATTASPVSPVSSGKVKSSSRPAVGPDGVAFSRRLHGASDSVSSIVNFTVTSELEVEAPVSEKMTKPEAIPLFKIITSSADEHQQPADTVRSNCSSSADSCLLS